MQIAKGNTCVKRKLLFLYFKITLEKYLFAEDNPELRECLKIAFSRDKRDFRGNLKRSHRCQYRDEHIGERDRFKVTEKISYIERNEF